MDDTISLKEYFEARLKAIEEVNQKTFELNNIAIQKAEDSVNFRLESMNEFRSAMKDQQATYLPIQEFKAHLAASQKSFEDLKEQINKLSTIQQVVAGKAGQPMVWIVGAGSIIGLILSIISLLQKWVAP